VEEAHQLVVESRQRSKAHLFFFICHFPFFIFRPTFVILSNGSHSPRSANEK
jgi:hypothetical protein